MVRNGKLEFASDVKLKASKSDGIAYGYWVTADGSMYVFDRGYQPFYRVKDGIGAPCKPQWVEHIVIEDHLWSDGADLKKRRLLSDFFMKGIDLVVRLKTH